VTASTPGTASDRIVLTLPQTEPLADVATLVLGGIGTRLDLPYEKLDDLQLAVVSVLSASASVTVTLEIDIHDDAVSITVAPLPASTATDAGMHQVLSRLVDAVEAGVDETSDSGGWITLRLARPRSGSA
jgi:hypothetical protein